jgi:23S rRNA G2069 N7-methylase RlmK/C1962 C5-methylase RlmI
LEWDEAVLVNEEWYRDKISSIGLRKKLFDSKDTNAFRLIFSEGDLLPGLCRSIRQWDEAVLVNEEWYRDKISSAIGLRKKLFDSKDTNAFRLIFSEGDLLPGLGKIEGKGKTASEQAHLYFFGSGDR